MKRIRRSEALLVFLSCLFFFAAAEVADRSYWNRKARRDAGEHGDVFEIFVLGESSAFGEPYAPWISFPKITSRMFADRIANRDIRIRNLAESGSTLYPQVIALERELRQRRKDIPGVVFIYSGHNESGISPNRFHAFDALVGAIEQRSLRRSVVLTDLLLRAERAHLVYGLRGLDSYERNLRRAVQDSLDAGLTPILSTVIGNVSDIEPGLSAIAPRTREGVMRIIKKGEELEVRGRFNDAANYYASQLLLIQEGDPLRNYLLFRVGKCHEKTGRYEAAREAYWKVIDSGNSGGFARASSAQNAAVAKVAREYAVPFVDAVAFFEKRAAHGLVGDQFFSDGHHPNVRGYIILARAFGETLSGLVHEPMTHPGITPQELFSAFDFGPTEQAHSHLTRAGWLLKSSRPHLYPKWRMQLARSHMDEALRLGTCTMAARSMLGAIDAELAGSPLSDGKLSALEQLVAHCRRRQEVSVCSGAGDFKQALAQLDAIPGPETVDTLIEKARCHVGLGQRDAALSALARAVQLGPNPAQRRQLADGYFAAGEFKHALEQLDALAGPEDFDALIRKAWAHLRLGQKVAALSALSQAANLGPTQSQRRQLADGYFAAEDFKRTLEQLDALPGPEDVDTLIEKARAYAGLGQQEPASAVLNKAQKMVLSSEQQNRIALIFQELKDYRNALSIFDELTAGHPKDINYLVSRGVCEYLAGSNDESVASLKEAIRLDSRFLPAYLTLGYIYERQQRYPQAMKLYELALAKSVDQPMDSQRAAVVESLKRAKMKAQSL